MFTKETIHYRPLEGNGNVRCLNGSAHARYNWWGNGLEGVTCSLCLDPNTNKEYWNEARERQRTKLHYSPITGKNFERFR